jgi:RNA polymerase sigma factor (sigma-70 family)
VAANAVFANEKPFMTPDALETLLAKLCQGDTAAAEMVVREYEPYLRMIVRRRLPRQLRAKFDSLDVVQSVWVHVLHGFRGGEWQFENVARFRAFLVKVTRNRLADRLRHFTTSLKREQMIARDQGLLSSTPKPSEVAQAGDLWEKMLTICPTEHREILRLKRRGLPLAEIADRTGFHADSIRRIIRRVARQISVDPSSRLPTLEKED